MSEKATKEELSELHGLLAKTFKKILDSGDYKASDLNVIRQFLKDNNIESTAPEGSPLFNLTKAMPHFDDDGNVVQ